MAKVTKVHKEFERALIKKLNSFRPGRVTVRKKVNTAPFLGMLLGFVFGVGWLVCFWNDVSSIVPQHSYRFGAIGVLGFPIVTTLLGIIAGWATDLLVHKLRG